MLLELLSRPLSSRESIRKGNPEEKSSLEKMKEDIAKKRNKAERLPTEGGQSYSQGVRKSRCVVN